MPYTCKTLQIQHLLGTLNTIFDFLVSGYYIGNQKNHISFQRKNGRKR